MTNWDITHLHNLKIFCRCCCSGCPGCPSRSRWWRCGGLWGCCCYFLLLLQSKKSSSSSRRRGSKDRDGGGHESSPHRESSKSSSRRRRRGSKESSTDTYNENSDVIDASASPTTSVLGGGSDGNKEGREKSLTGVNAAGVDAEEEDDSYLFMGATAVRRPTAKAINIVGMGIQTPCGEGT